MEPSKVIRRDSHYALELRNAALIQRVAELEQENQELRDRVATQEHQIDALEERLYEG